MVFQRLLPRSARWAFITAATARSVREFERRPSELGADETGNPNSDSRGSQQKLADVMGSKRASSTELTASEDRSDGSARADSSSAEHEVEGKAQESDNRLASSAETVVFSLNAQVASSSALQGTSSSTLLQKVEGSAYRYSTSGEISAALRQYAAASPERFSVETLSDSGVSMDVLHYTPPKEVDIGKKAFLTFGMHARELISSEVGLRFVQGLATSTLPLGFELRVVVNVNPTGRDSVLQAENEGGHRSYDHGACERGNAMNLIDLNRNFGGAGNFGSSSADINPTGAAAFSEPESRMLRKALEGFDYDAFIDSHTGEYSLVLPWAHKKELPSEYFSKLIPLAEWISGPSGKAMAMSYGAVPVLTRDVVGGSGLDFATSLLHDKGKVLYTMAFEMYGRHPWDSNSIYFDMYRDAEYRAEHDGKDMKFFSTPGFNAWSSVEAQAYKSHCLYNMFTPMYQDAAESVMEAFAPLYGEVLMEIARREGWARTQVESMSSGSVVHSAARKEKKKGKGTSRSSGVVVEARDDEDDDESSSEELFDSEKGGAPQLLKHKGAEHSSSTTPAAQTTRFCLFFALLCLALGLLCHSTGLLAPIISRLRVYLARAENRQLKMHLQQIDRQIDSSMLSPGNVKGSVLAAVAENGSKPSRSRNANDHPVGASSPGPNFSSGPSRYRDLLDFSGDADEEAATSLLSKSWEDHEEDSFFSHHDTRLINAANAYSISSGHINNRGGGGGLPIYNDYSATAAAQQTSQNTHASQHQQPHHVYQHTPYDYRNL
ncbi:unnamed protein product [Amoebophrya sp. A25]|nr:unnamed protein product [Amoebophrya sp. A25]|eukprot:GSA25T00005062001.1